MRTLKIIVVLVLLVVGGVFYVQFADDNDQPITTASNDEYKQKQDDKDSVVETNKHLLIEVEKLREQIGHIEKQQQQHRKTNQSESNIGYQINVDKERAAVNETVAEQPDNPPVSRVDEVSEQGKHLVNDFISQINKNLPKADYKNPNGVTPTGNRQDIQNTGVLADSHGYVWIDAIQSNAQTAVQNQSRSQIPNNTANTVVNSNPVAGNKQSSKQVIPKFTIPANSALGGVLTTGMLGRVPVNGQVVDPYRFTVQITKQSLFANFHTNHSLRGMMLSGTAQGDLLLSCVKASIDSITFIFDDGTISQNEGVDLATLTDDYGYPCIKGRLITNAAEYLSLSSAFSALSSAADAFATSQQTTTTNADGVTTESVTGNSDQFALGSALSSGTSDVQNWLDERAAASFDVIFVPSGESIRLITQRAVSIDYDGNGRKLVHEQNLAGAVYERLD